MAYYTVKPGNIFGRVGQGVGKGLAEQLPKEIERSRLSQGLKDLGGKQNLTPFQQFAELSGIPGITPQMIQSGTELLKNQSMRQGIARRAGRQGREEQPQFAQQIRDVNFANVNPQDQLALANENVAMTPSQREQETINQPNQPQIVETNPLRAQALPQAPWTPERFNQELDDLAQDFPNATVPELVNMAKENEKRYLAQSEVERAKDAYTQEIRDKVDNEFTKQLELKLQKKGEGVFQDITGENIARMKRLVEKDLKTNPNANINNIVNTRTNQLLDLAKSKNKVREQAAKPIYEKILKGSEIKKGLEAAAKTFRNTGNSQEYWNILQKDFNMSPQGSASIAYPPSKQVNSYLNQIKPSNITNFRENSRKYASDIENLLTNNDSLLSIAYNLRQKDPNFDETSFFDQLNEDDDNLRLNPQQKDELTVRTSDIFPNWGDLSILPVIRGLK